MPIYDLCWEEHHCRQALADSPEAARAWWRGATPEELGDNVVDCYDLVAAKVVDKAASEGLLQDETTVSNTPLPGSACTYLVYLLDTAAFRRDAV